MIIDNKYRKMIQKNHQQKGFHLTVGKNFLLNNCMTVCESIMSKKYRTRVEKNHQQKRFHLTVGKNFLLNKCKTL